MFKDKRVMFGFLEFETRGAGFRVEDLGSGVWVTALNGLGLQGLGGSAGCYRLQLGLPTALTQLRLVYVHEHTPSLFLCVFTNTCVYTYIYMLFF